MPLKHPLPDDGLTRMCVVCYSAEPRRQRPAVSMNYRGHAVCAEHETLTAPHVHAAANKHRPR